MRAAITYEPFYGEKLRAPKACWSYSLGVSNPRTLYSDSVSIGMLEMKAVVILIVQGDKFFIPEPQWSDYSSRGYSNLGVTPGQPLEYGEWKITIQLDGDNYASEFQYKMNLLPDGSSGWAALAK